MPNDRRRRPPDDLQGQLDRMERMLRILLRMEDAMAAEMDALKAEVEETKTAQASAILLLQSLSQMLKDAIATGDPAALVALAADLDNSTRALADAITANTPAAPNS